jgi:hypothetical protein
MPYIVSKHYRRKDGSHSWRIIWETTAGGERKQRHIPKEEWLMLGFSPSMSFEEARARAKQINSQAWLKRRERIRNEIQLRLQKEDHVESAYLPELFVQQFEKEVLFRRFARGDQKTMDRKKLGSHWRAVKRVIRDLNLDPSDWAEQPQTIYAQFQKLQASPSYTQKLVRMMNLWGYFISKRTNKAFLPLPSPRGYDLEQIADAFFEKDHNEKRSAPITPEKLESAKSQLIDSQYRWLYITVWLGLRPQEVDQLKGDETWKTTNDGAVQILWVYQPKLRAVPRERRWKLIPLLFPEQLVAFEFITSKNFDRPLPKTVRKWVNSSATCYGGRKGFTDLMLSKGQQLEDISAWLGHTTIERTWRSYKDKQRVHYKKVA